MFKTRILKKGFKSKLPGGHLKKIGGYKGRKPVIITTKKMLLRFVFKSG